jgi:SHAQKYF class myb-like DNA-binding protein
MSSEIGDIHDDADELLPALPPIDSIRMVTCSESESTRSDGSYSDSTPAAGSKRKGVDDGNCRSARDRKGKEDKTKKIESSKDPRWSKRFTWPDELHRDFVAAVFDVGLKHSSPRVIMDHMKPNPEVMVERVKSHLQKYRLNHEKSRQEFITSYDEALGRFKKNPPGLDDVGDHKFSCGEWAALLSHSVQTEATITKGSQTLKGDNRELSDQSPAQNQNQGGTSTQRVPDGVPTSIHSGATKTRGRLPSQGPSGVSTLHLPLLSIEESESPIGQQLGYLVGMFHTLCQDLEIRRRHQSAFYPLSYLLENYAATAPSQSNQMCNPELGSHIVQRQNQQDSLHLTGAFSQVPYSHQGKQDLYVSSQQDRGNSEVLHWNQPPIIHQPTPRYARPYCTNGSPNAKKVPSAMVSKQNMDNQRAFLESPVTINEREGSP